MAKVEKVEKVDIPKVIPEVKVRSKPTVMVRCTMAALHHPYQLRWIPNDVFIEVINDSWVDSQVAAGLIEIEK